MQVSAVLLGERGRKRNFLHRSWLWS